MIDLETLMISVRRGTPSVTFFAETPAKWNVLSVICVVGSPIDCAATVPTTSPGCATAAQKRASTSPTSHSNASGDRRCSRRTRLAASVDRSRQHVRSVALRCASAESGSSPSTTFSLVSQRSLTRLTTSSGSSADDDEAAEALLPSPAEAPEAEPPPPPAPQPKACWAFQIRRLRFMGRTTDASPLRRTSCEGV